MSLSHLTLSNKICVRYLKRFLHEGSCSVLHRTDLKPSALLVILYVSYVFINNSDEKYIFIWHASHDFSYFILLGHQHWVFGFSAYMCAFSAHSLRWKFVCLIFCLMYIVYWLMCRFLEVELILFLATFKLPLIYLEI